MGRITERLIRQRAEHNEGMVSTLEEVALHQQNIEKIEVIGHLCPKLKILYLQNNLIGKIQNLHKLKDLEYLNLAVNNVTKIQNLQRCESLRKLDLTINFVGKAGLLSVASLAANIHLEELYLLGNPCSDWPGYRQYVVAQLPQLKKLDGQAIKPSERISAQQALPSLHAALLAELAAEGVDVGAAGEVEDDSLLYDEAGGVVAEVPETGWVDEAGELVRPWCPATRILEHRETEAANRAAEEKKRAASATSTTPATVDPQDPQQQQPPASSAAAAAPPSSSSTSTSGERPGRREGFPELKDGERVYQKNEGRWDFSLEESPDGRCLQLEVGLGRYLDTSLIATDLQPTLVRLLVKGKLLQLLLPCEVRPDAATAQRNMSNGHLLLTLPKEDPDQPIIDVAKLRPKVPGTTGTAAPAMLYGNNNNVRQQGNGCTTASAVGGGSAGGRGAGGGGGASIYNIVKTHGSEEGDFVIKEVRKAAVTAVSGDDEDGDDPPDL
ncbi:hypothetical protein Agub_g9558 [Astrephomene gubernaculifera]|uniref:Dynein axonemal assembly factor 11-like CS domain-containing protein n=1 Tax=Astrephomene gubernaculifera TaxID=47775 RepID=A0AAD3DTE6_9CHLO|nr:hypothetical protein Agub_g9558 [Astrephomene gubernaculifera]